MYIVKAQNILTEKQYQAQFDSNAEANQWLQSHIDRETWGRNARQAIRGQEAFEEELVISESDSVDEFGETIVTVELKAEYLVTEPRLIDGSGSTQEDKDFRLKIAIESAERMRVYKDFGIVVELYFIDMINVRGYTQAQKDSLQVNADVGAVLSELGFGRIGNAKKLVDAIVADQDLFFESDLALVSQLMSDFLENL